MKGVRLLIMLMLSSIRTFVNKADIKAYETWFEVWFIFREGLIFGKELSLTE